MEVGDWRRGIGGGGGGGVGRVQEGEGDVCFWGDVKVGGKGKDPKWKCFEFFDHANFIPFTYKGPM